MPYSRLSWATATLVALIGCSVQVIYAARLNRAASAFVPSFRAPSQIGYRPVSINEARAESVTCWARRSDKRKRSSGPLGPAPSLPVEDAALAAPTEATDPAADSAVASEGAGQRAGRGTGFGQARAPVTSKDVDEAYERALRKLKNKGDQGGVLFEGVEPGGGPATPKNKTIVTRNVDVFDLIPDNVQLGFERTLIAALSLNLVVLITLGIGFAFQALPASSVDLPEGVRAAALQVKEVVDKYEGLFTPSLGTFFVFSSLLGSFKVAQLGRGGTTYTEYNEDD